MGVKGKNRVKWEKYQRAKQAQRWPTDRERAAPGPRLRCFFFFFTKIHRAQMIRIKINFKGDARGTVQVGNTSTDV